MKFSIDYKQGNCQITGWAANQDGASLKDGVVKIEGLTVKPYATNLTVLRPDVMSAGLHKTGFCGFSFEPKKIGYANGDFLKVTIDSSDAGSVSKILMLGYEQDLIKSFDALEFKRDDDSVLQANTSDVLVSSPDFIAFKILLIRLRRSKRGKGWRGEFSGRTNLHVQSDWIAFRHIVETCSWELYSKLSTRYLWSVIDTFADYAHSEEKLAALALSSVLITERFAQSWINVYDFNPKVNPVQSSQIHYWGRMLTNKFDADDALDVYITRMIESLKDHPIIYSLFIETFLRMSVEEKSIFGFNLSQSNYFKNAFDYYKNRFLAEKISFQETVAFSKCFEIILI